jgi:hypothetical protein
MRDVTRKLTIDLPEELAAGAEAEAKRGATDMVTVVEHALVGDLGLGIKPPIQERFHLDEQAAMKLAYEELRATRNEPGSA